jgi:eukaryotic-like serine/threonine-protein kinase
MANDASRKGSSHEVTDSSMRVQYEPGETAPFQTPQLSIDAFPGEGAPPGTVFGGRFRIIRLIARGGMGEVYEAEDLALQVRIALKTIRPVIASGIALERFRRELLLARKITHPNVCRLFEFYSVGGEAGPPQVFLTMELLDGEALSERLRRVTVISEEVALPIVRQLVAALSAAHHQGVVHRDFKSSNVMLVSSPDGERTVVTDFGIARALGGASEATATGEGMVGTPAYMSPEQVTGGEVTPASDVYALGIVMYEMVTGTLPFSGKTPSVAAMRRLVEPAPPPKERSAGLSRTWNDTILRCLRGDPRERFARVEDVLLGLEGERPGAWVAPGRSRRLVLAAGLVLALAGVVAGTIAVRKRAAPQPPFVAAVPAPRRPAGVLTFVNRSSDPSLDWLGTALPELLASRLAELPALRVFPRQTVATGERSLGIPSQAALDADHLRRFRDGLGPELTVAGRYQLEGESTGRKLRVELHFQDVERGGTIATVSEMGDLSDLRELIARLAEKLRVAMAWDVARPEERDFWRSPIPADPLPTDPEAMRLYSEGLARARRWDGFGARSLLEKAAAREPRFPYTHWALAHLGDVSERFSNRHVLEAAAGVSGEERELLEVGAACFDGADDAESCQAAEPTLRRLWERHRGDVEFGILIAENAPPTFALATIAELRKLPAPASADVRLDLLESGTISWNPRPDWNRVLTVASHGEAFARQRGDRFNLAMLLWFKGDALRGLHRGKDALAAQEESNRLMMEIGALATALWQTSRFANHAAELGGPAATRAAYQKALDLARRIGPAGRVNTRLLLFRLGQFELSAGNFDAVERISRELSALAEQGMQTPIDKPLHALEFHLLLEKGRLAEAEQLVRSDLRSCGEEPMCQVNARIFLQAILNAEDRSVEAAEEIQKMAVGPSTGVLQWVSIYHSVESGDAEHARQEIATMLQNRPEVANDWADTGILIIRNLLDLKQYAEAERVLHRMDPEAGLERWNTLDVARQKVLMGEIDLGLGRSAKAKERLGAVITQARKGGWKMVEFDARLAYGKAQRGAGDAAGSTRTFDSLEQEATSRGALRIARLAREERQSH